MHGGVPPYVGNQYIPTPQQPHVQKNPPHNQGGHQNFRGNVPRRRPLLMDRYKQLDFGGVPRYPNQVPTEVRQYLSRFSGSYALTSEEYLSTFFNLLDDFEVEHEDFIMKLYI